MCFFCSSFSKTVEESNDVEEEEKEEGVDKDEVFSFEEKCSNCRSLVETRMKLVGEKESSWPIV